jgi:Dullard-like phosphatase family protein
MNQGEMAQIYQGKTVISISPKVSNSSYTKPMNYNFNSPKNEGQRAILFSSNQNTSSNKYLTRADKSESVLERKNSRSNDTGSRNTQGPSSLTQLNGSPRVNVRLRPADEKLLTTDKKTSHSNDVISSMSKFPSPPKVSESLNLRELLKKDKPRRLEINTEYSSPKIMGTVSQTTKNKDVSEKIPNDSVKKNVNGSIVNKHALQTDSNANSTAKLRQSGVITRPSLSQDKPGAATPKKTISEKSSIYDPTRRTEKTLYTDNSMTQSTEMGKKAFSRTQLDLRAALKGIATDDPKNETQELKQSTKDNTRTEDKTPTQKVSLQTFVTKVNRNDMFAAKKTTTEKEESPANNKPYLMVDEKYGNKTPKASSNLFFKTSKTSTTQETKNTETDKKLKPTKPITPMRADSKDKENLEITESLQQDKKPFIYYMTNLEKYHRHHEYDYFSQIYKEHFIQSYQAMMFCKYLKPVDPKMLAQKRVYLNKRESHKDKKTLVFDLDETLIHCNESTDMPYDVKLPIRFPHGEIIEAGINIRPWVMDCLKELNQHFEIIVFTASHGCYANVVLDYLDPKQQYIHHRLFRESCVVTEEGIYIKDLRVLANRNLQDVVLVDNAAYSFGYQIENGIPVAPFYENKHDQELRHLVPYLKFLSGVKDLREMNKQTFKMHLYSMYDNPEKVLDKLFPK